MHRPSLSFIVTSFIVTLLALLATSGCQTAAIAPTSVPPQPTVSRDTIPGSQSSGAGKTEAVATSGPPLAKAADTPKAPPTSSTAAKAATPVPMKLKLAYSAISGPQSFIAIVQEAGLFTKHGLDVEVLFISSGSKAVQALLAGETPVVLVAGPVAIPANLAGGDVVMVATPMNTLDYVLVGAKDVKKPADLKGKAIAISRFGTQTDFVARYILRRNNLEPEKDVALIQVGESPQRYAALQSGAVQGTLVQPPFTLQAREAGYNEVVDMADLGLEFASTTWATSRAFIREKPDVIDRLVRATVEGVAFYKQTKDKEVIMHALSKYYRNDDRPILEETHRNYAKMLSKVPLATPAGIQIILDDLASERPEAKDAKPERFVDHQFVEKLQSSGFIDSLYR